MARGWESKAVESQQEDAERLSRPRRPLTPEERERAGRRRLLELALVDTEAELQAAHRPAHQAMLRMKVAAIRDEMQQVDPTPRGQS